ncbi:SMC family ATPase [Psychrilyobacter sp.]|uniref:SMC family ATPase n=1 Tax=Psychrilyobacter sp. TaxID=2586924 RepID=UPI00301736B9
MKPLRLKMYGIGPYASEIDIDFTRLNEEGLFLITGATGAGKTSIFDGITYALYSETNFKDDQKKNGIICDYLENHQHKDAYVEFTFEVDKVEYIVKRVPAHYGYKKNGEKNITKTGEKVEIDTNSKKVIPGNKDDRDKYIREEILKVDVSQFKKLIMLPQGAFSEFIRSNSNSKTKTLEKIFNTDIYKSITEKLRDRVNDLEIEQKEAKDNIFAKLETLNIYDQRWTELLKGKILTFEELNQIMETKKNNLKEEKKAVGKEIQKLDLQNIMDIIAKGEVNNKGVTELKEAKKKLERLNENSKFIEEKKEKLKIFKLANEIKVEYANKINSTKDYEIKDKEYSDFLRRYAEYRDKNDLKIESIDELTKDLDLLNGRISTLDLLKDDVEKYDDLFKKIEKNDLSLKKEKISLIKKEELEQQELLKKEELKKNRTKIEEDLRKGTELKLEKEGCKTKKIILKDIVEKYIEISKDEKELGKKKSELEKLIVEENEKLKKYKEQSDLWFESKAYNFVGRLEIGKPCPVCGSIEHPAKAEKPKDVPTKEELKGYEDSHEEVKTKKGEFDGEIKSLKTNIIKQKDELKIKMTEENLDDDYENIQKLEKKNKERIKEIKTQLEILSTLEELKKLEKEEFLNIKDIERTNKEKQELKDRIIILKRDLEHDEEERASLKIKLEENDITVSTFDGDYKKIVEETNTKKSEKTKIENLKRDRENKESTLEERSKNLKELKTAMKETNKLFEQKLKEKNFSDEEEYLDAKAIDGDKMEEEITSHKDSLTTVNAIIGEKKDHEGTELIDLTALEKEKDLAVKKIEELNNNFSKKEIEISQLNEKQENLKSINKIFEKNYEVLNIHTKLLDISEGKYGEKKNKVTFQSYVLGVYFEEVLDRANERFTKMTNNQYQMILHRGDSTGNGKAGLDINVFDSHTGKERSIKTLSGGETFKASMALAPGLSDVVQAQNGGIQLDSVFIDEGFGTLDEESLSAAMDILMGLKCSGRTVGIISHVNELKQTITSQIRVTKTSRGSEVEVVF